MSQENNLDLESDRRSIVGMREFDAPRVIEEYGAAQGLVQNLARLSAYVAAQSTK